jgi:hypothetical protein
MPSRLSFQSYFVTSEQQKPEVTGVPYGNRTRVAAVKGRCPRPLDERDADGELVAQRRKRVTLSYWVCECQIRRARAQ